MFPLLFSAGACEKLPHAPCECAPFAGLTLDSLNGVSAEHNRLWMNQYRDWIRYPLARNLGEVPSEKPSCVSVFWSVPVLRPRSRTSPFRTITHSWLHSEISRWAMWPFR